MKFSIIKEKNKMLVDGLLADAIYLQTEYDPQAMLPYAHIIERESHKEGDCVQYTILVDEKVKIGYLNLQELNELTDLQFNEDDFRQFKKGMFGSYGIDIGMWYGHLRVYVYDKSYFNDVKTAFKNILERGNLYTGSLKADIKTKTIKIGDSEPYKIVAILFNPYEKEKIEVFGDNAPKISENLEDFNRIFQTDITKEEFQNINEFAVKDRIVGISCSFDKNGEYHSGFVRLNEPKIEYFKSLDEAIKTLRTRSREFIEKSKE